MIGWIGWVSFLAAIVALLLVDLLIFHRRPHEVETKEAAVWSAFWIGLGLLFSLVVWTTLGADAAQSYLAGYLIEKSLSVDNLFIFVLIFGYFEVPAKYQHRVLFYGVLGAFVFRGIFIALGAALLARFSWVAFLFGAFLLYTAYRLAWHGGIQIDPKHNPVLSFLRRFLPVTRNLHGHRLFVRRGRRWAFTPLLAVLVIIETTDVMFAVDSIPAVFGVTRDAFIVFSSNALALLGLRALYFLLADMVGRFHYLDDGLAIVLALIGVKMIHEELVHMYERGSAAWFPGALAVELPSWASLVMVGVVLGTAIWLSLRNPRQVG